MTLASVRETVFIDAEHRGTDTGNRPHTVCIVAKEYKSGREFRMWLDDCPRTKPPFASGPDVLFVCYFAPSELGCYLSLGWELPEHVVDLYPEFRNLTNGHAVLGGRGLLGALQWFGLDGIEGAKKDSMRSRILAGAPYSAKDRQAILDYCESDVDALKLLFPRLITRETNLNYVLLRGEYTKSIARMEHAGIPVDAGFYQRMVEHRPVLRDYVIDRVNQQIPVYENRVFRESLFERFIESLGAADIWPETEAGSLSTSDDTFSRMTALYPALEPLRETRQLLAQLKEPALTIGRDNRNRAVLSPFGTVTSRNKPSGNKFIFGCPSFMRNLIRPEPGKALLYSDWSQQEFGIAGALSGDGNMLRAYESGDPYISFAQLAGAVPAGATEESHPRERNLFKQVVLATQYQQGANELALRIGSTLHEAEDLLSYHYRIFGTFWTWSDGVCDYAQLRGTLTDTFGWQLHYTPSTTIRTLRNWPMQTNGAAMLRLACILLAKSGVSVIAPVHDAILLECDERDVEQSVYLTREAMRRASAVVLTGFNLRSKINVIRQGDRFPEHRGIGIWNLLQDRLSNL